MSDFIRVHLEVWRVRGFLDGIVAPKAFLCLIVYIYIYIDVIEMDVSCNTFRI